MFLDFFRWSGGGGAENFEPKKAYESFCPFKKLNGYGGSTGMGGATPGKWYALRNASHCEPLWAKKCEFF